MDTNRHGAIGQPPDRPSERAYGAARRLREIYRSAGWPCQDPLEIELLAAGLLDRVQAPSGHESLRVTQAGVQLLTSTLAANRAAFSAHEALVERVALEMGRAGRIAWRGLALRAQVPHEVADKSALWCIARPDVFSIRNTSVAKYVDPIVHEVKVRRADLLGDLRHGAKRNAYARAAPRRSREGLPFGVWMALAKATPVTGLDEDAQAMLGSPPQDGN